MALAVFAIAMDVTLYSTQPFGEEFYIYADWAAFIFAASAAAMGFYAFRAHGRGEMAGKAFLAFALGFVFQALGELAWTYQEVIVGIEVPTVSIADLFWVLVYPFFIAGFYYMWRLAKIRLEGDRKLTTFFVLKMLVLLALVSIYGFYPNYIDPELADLEKSVLIGYILMAFIMLAFAITILFSLIRKSLFSYWIIIVAAFAIFAFADITYSQLAGLYEVNNPITALWDISYILIAFGFFYNRQTFNDKDYDSLLLSQREEEIGKKKRKPVEEEKSLGQRLVERSRR